MGAPPDDVKMRTRVRDDGLSEHRLDEEGDNLLVGELGALGGGGAGSWR